MLIRVEARDPDVSRAFAFDWKLRCAAIKSTSSAVTSTLERSFAPLANFPTPEDPG